MVHASETAFINGTYFRKHRTGKMGIQNNKKHDRMVHRRGSSSILSLRMLTMGEAETMPSTLDRAMPSRDHDEDGDDGSEATAAAATAAAVDR